MKSRHLLDGESVADHMFKTKTKIILYDHTPSECQDSVICHIRSPQGAKKVYRCEFGLDGIAIRSVGVPQEATAEIKCSV